jgi:hypothetical protein
MNDLRMELKVCEGCGALWLRTSNQGGIYCRSCRSRLSQLPAAKGHHRLLGPRRKPAGPPQTAGLTVLAGGAR